MPAPQKIRDILLTPDDEPVWIVSPAESAFVRGTVPIVFSLPEGMQVEELQGACLFVDDRLKVYRNYFDHRDGRISGLAFKAKRQEHGPRVLQVKAWREVRGGTERLR